MIKKTPPTHPDYDDLTKALSIIKAAAETINAKKGEVEKFQVLLDLSTRITGLPKQFEPFIRQDRYVF